VGVSQLKDLIAVYDQRDLNARRDGREAYARSHPIRARILSLYAEDKERSLTATDLQRELDELPRSTVAMVAYHLQVLQSADLAPETLP